MQHFGLPKNTEVNRVIPKNAFDRYTNTKQKQKFTDFIQRITWTHKISRETVNLPSKRTKEIQIFHVLLKVSEDIQELLDVIDKAIPYQIIFVIQFQDRLSLSTAIKRLIPNKNSSVIEIRFTVAAFSVSLGEQIINLSNSIDYVLKSFILGMLNKPHLIDYTLDEIVEKELQINKLKLEISKLKSKIRRSRSFKRKVDLNVNLNKIESELGDLESWG